MRSSVGPLSMVSKDSAPDKSTLAVTLWIEDLIPNREPHTLLRCG